MTFFRIIAIFLFAQSCLPDVAHAQFRGCALSIPADIGWPRPSTELFGISGGLISDRLNIPGKIDVPAQRAHMWNLFEGITRPSNPTDRNSVPIFSTWYSIGEAFDKTPGKIDCNQRTVSLMFEPSSQFLIGAKNPVVDVLRQQGLELGARFDPQVPRQLENKANTKDENAVFSEVAYNQELYDFIRQNEYFLLEKLIKNADPERIRVPINPSPTKSAALKFAWWPIAKEGLTPLPVWDWDPQNPGDEINPPSTWKRVVAVDPSGTTVPVPSIDFYGRTILNPNVVKLDRFYAVKLTPEQARQANGEWRLEKAAKEVLGRNLEQGDYVVMTAMHIMTQEFSPWTFGTFWWHDRPAIKKYGEDRPAKIGPPWSNYIADVSFNINLPREPTGEALIAYNPWLEFFNTGGQRSGCMACHARAAAAAKGVRGSYNPKVAGTTDPNGFNAIPDGESDTAFQKGTVTVNRIWTLNIRTRP
jgi:hypothetical protein